MIKNNFKNKKSGFTLLEALVAVSILMVAVVAPITIAQKGLSSAAYSKNQMIASYLAQDAIEYIKNKRDEVAINNNYDWNNLSIFGNTSSVTLCKSSNGCQIDTIKNVINDNTAVLDFDQNKPLIEDNNGFYGYSTGVDFKTTNFTRQIKISMLDANSALITVMVTWGTDSITVKDMIYNY